jgi:hypothetical protein
MKEVLWCPALALDNAPEKQTWKNIGYFDPEPVLKDIILSREKQADYLVCPAYNAYFKNTFIIRSPIDIVVRYEKNQDGTSTIKTDRHDQEFFEDMFNVRQGQNSSYPMLSLNSFYLFLSNESMILESIPAFFHSTTLLQNTRVIPGTFDIGKWWRPVDFSFEVLDETKPLVFKRGDPLFYVRLISNENIKLTRTEFSPEIKSAMYSCTGLKRFVPRASLEENYEAAKSYLGYLKSKIFPKKSKCPFHFWKR